MIFSACVNVLRTKVKCIANLIVIVSTAISDSNCDCILGIVEDVERVASVPGGDIIII